MVTAIISALPNFLGTLKTILANSIVEPTLAEVKVQILNDEQRRIRELGAGATTFFAKASKKTKESKEKEKEKGKKYCMHCDICGHNVSDCRKLKKEKEQEAEGTTKPQGMPAPTTSSSKAITQKDSTTASANIAMALSMTQPVVHLFTALALVGGTNILSATPLADIKQEWITDSSASHTMCSN